MARPAISEERVVIEGPQSIRVKAKISAPMSEIAALSVFCFPFANSAFQIPDCLRLKADVFFQASPRIVGVAAKEFLAIVYAAGGIVIIGGLNTIRKTKVGSAMDSRLVVFSFLLIQVLSQKCTCLRFVFSFGNDVSEKTDVRLFDFRLLWLIPGWILNFFRCQWITCTAIIGFQVCGRQ
jgi:hypothetical protein